MGMAWEGITCVAVVLSKALLMRSPSPTRPGEPIRTKEPLGNLAEAYHERMQCGAAANMLPSR
jgi:hypothetical protein